MPCDYYPQKTVEELLLILDSVQKRQSTGVVAFYGAAGVQQQRSFQGASRVEVELRRILFSLHLRDPVIYPDPTPGASAKPAPAIREAAQVLLDYKLICDADELAGQYVHKKNGLVHAYRGFFELREEVHFRSAELALRQFVLARRLMLL